MSQRVLIIGVSESGKSSLARKLIEGAKLPYFVHDPILSDWRGARLVTDSMEVFCEAVEKFGQPCIAAVDEAGEALTVGQKQYHKVFTRWRHKAILPIVMAQRYKMIAPNVRVNATDVYLFETARTDCEELAIDFNCPELLGACEFEPGDFFHLRKREGKKLLTRHRLW
jgi:hypothetical protein